MQHDYRLRRNAVAGSEPAPTKPVLLGKNESKKLPDFGCAINKFSVSAHPKLNRQSGNRSRDDWARRLDLHLTLKFKAGGLVRIFLIICLPRSFSNLQARR